MQSVKYVLGTLDKPRGIPCHICGGIFNVGGVYDHCHIHGWIRGILCYGCNRIMGHYDKGRYYSNWEGWEISQITLKGYRKRCADCTNEAHIVTIHDSSHNRPRENDRGVIGQ